MFRKGQKVKMTEDALDNCSLCNRFCKLVIDISVNLCYNQVTVQIKTSAP